MRIIQIYNEAYNDYLTGKRPEEFLQDMLYKIIELIKCKDGLIIKFDSIRPIIVCKTCDDITVNLSRDDIRDYIIKDQEDIIIPILFGKSINGAIILLDCENINCDGLLDFGIMMGTLFYNMKYPTINKELELLRETLDTLDDQIIIIRSDRNIVYGEYDNIIESVETEKIYKNEILKIKINGRLQEYCINTLSINNTLYHVIRQIKNNNSKNLMAYLSHELRNPLQAISTGIYIIDRSINGNICDLSINTSYNTQRSYIDTISPTQDDNILLDSINSLDSLESDISESRKSVSECSDVNDTRVLKSVIKRVNSSCKNMNVIIDDILDLTKIENDELNINYDHHKIRDITDLVYEESFEAATRKGLNFKYEYDERSPEYFHTDSTRVFQILTNLISNSIKYSSSGTILFKVSSEDSNIIFEVSDQGRGIKKEELPNLFKMFGRTSNRESDINSSGLGLFICQRIANLLGGRIEVWSEYNKGSSFKFIHPIINNNINKSEREYVVKNNTNGRILIIDDDPNLIVLFKLLLKCIIIDNEYDIIIDTATSIDKAYSLMKNRIYNIIFLDLKDDWYEICQEIKKNNTNIIALTADINSVQNDRDERYNVFSDVIIKPFNDRVIDCVIKKYMNQK